MKYNVEVVESADPVDIKGEDLSVGVYVTRGTFPEYEKEFILIVGHNGGRVGFDIEGLDISPRDWSKDSYDSRIFYRVRPVRSFDIKVTV